MTAPDSNPVAPISKPSRVSWMLAVCQWLACVSLLATAITPVAIAFIQDQRVVPCIAFGSAVLAGAGGAAVRFRLPATDAERREAKGLMIVGIVVVLLVLPLMASTSLRAKLQGLRSGAVGNSTGAAGK